jgi:hypothetical protein
MYPHIDTLIRTIYGIAGDKEAENLKKLSDMVPSSFIFILEKYSESSI